MTVVCLAALSLGAVCLRTGTLTRAWVGSGAPGYFHWSPAKGPAAQASGGNGGTYTTFDAPTSCAGTGAVQGTIPVSMNASGTIVGFCIDASMAYHGFMRTTDGTITVLNDPNAGTAATQGTVALSVNASGTIVGVYFDDITSYHGFMYSDGTFTEIDAPGAGNTTSRGTTATAINAAGEIAGVYTTGTYQGSSEYFGFVRAVNGTYTSFSATNAGTGYEQGTRGVGIDAGGDVTGFYQDASNLDHGFVRSGAAGNAITEFDVPGAATSGCMKKSFKPTQATTAIAIDAAANIAGVWEDPSCVQHGFVRSGVSPFTISSFDGPGASTTPGMFGGTFGVSIDAGVIAGNYSDTNGILHGLIRTAAGTITAPLDAPGAGTGTGAGLFEGTVAFSINDSGNIAGTYSDPSGVLHGFYLVPTSTGGGSATVSPTSLSFGNEALDNTSAAKKVTLTNTGTSELDISSVAASGDFAISANTCGSTLAAGKKCTVSVTFTPTALGALAGTLTFTDDATNSPQTVALTGTGVEPATLSPTSYTFKAETVGETSAAHAFTLTNNESGTLSSISSSVTGDFAISATTCSTTLASKKSCTISVTFTPLVAGTLTGTLTVKDSASNSPQTASLTGTGNNPKPKITSLSPSTATAGGAQFTLTVNGTGFVTTSVAKWAGSSLATTYVSGTKVTAIVPATDIATAGTFKVTVTNLAPGGGTSAASDFTVDNPAPTLTKVSPSSATHGGAAFTLTATGTGYVAGSKIQWNGADLTTTFVSSTSVTATVSATDIKTAGTASVTVNNPTPGGGTSGAKTFTIN